MIDSRMILLRSEALNFTCPYCYAAPFQRCFDPKTKIDIEKQPAHFKRLQAISNPQGV